MTRADLIALAIQRAEIAASKLKSLQTGFYGERVSAEILFEAEDHLRTATRHCEDIALKTSDGDL